MPLADASPLKNPLVGGLDEFLQVGIGQHTRRNVGRQRGDRRRAAAESRASRHLRLSCGSFPRLIGAVGTHHSFASLPGAWSPK